MDPLTIIGSVIALTQAADRTMTLATKVRRYSRAPDEITSLINEISDLGLVLGKLQSNTPMFPVQELPTLQKLLDSCNSIMLQVENIIQDVCVKSIDSGGSKEPRFRRLVWLRKKSEIDRLSQQLRDSRTLLTLQLVGVNASLQSQIALALPQLNQLMSHTKDAQTGLQDGLDKILEKMETSISEISDHFSKKSKDFRLRRPGMKHHSPQQNTDAKSSPKSV